MERDLMINHLWKHTKCQARIQQLEVEVKDLMTQVHEGKFMYDYQTVSLEKKIEELKEQIADHDCDYSPPHEGPSKGHVCSEPGDWSAKACICPKKGPRPLNDPFTIFSVGDSFVEPKSKKPAPKKTEVIDLK